MTVYADNAATTKTSDEAIEAMLPFYTEIYANPSSIHGQGEAANLELEKARTTVASLLGANAEEIYFTSGGTEADNWAIKSAALQGAKKGKKHIISSTFEHHAVLHTLNELQEDGFEITLIDVTSNGLINPSDVKKAIRKDTALVTLMFANNEIGTVLPIAEIGKICREANVLFHTDAVQAFGHVEIDVEKQNIDMLSLSAHKFHGPKGVGLLYAKKGVALKILMQGGAQEKGKRGGTENMPAIAGMANAMQKAKNNMQHVNEKLAGFKSQLFSAFSLIPRAYLNGDLKESLPNIINFSFEGVEGESLLLMLSAKGISASSGSACTSGSLDPSHVLLAIGRTHEVAHGSLRISLSNYNTQEEIEYIINTLPPIVKRLRDMSPMWEKIEKGEL